MRQIFVPAVGQYENIGDIVLRRPLLDFLRPHGRLHIYLGPSPEGYRAGLALHDEDVVYSSFPTWYRALVRSGTDYAFKPGEIQLSAAGMKEHVAMLPALALIRLRRGSVVRVGSGAREASGAWALPVRPSVGLSTLVAWRDGDTARLLGGEVMPDLGFATGSGGDGRHRGVLVVSMRGDRPSPSDDWIEAGRRVSDQRGLTIVAATQVRRDDARTRELAERLDGTAITWDGVDHARQEDALRDLYRGCAIAVSDRLHVLITAVTEGAAPVAPLTAPSTKIDRHLLAAGFPAVSFDAAEANSGQIVELIEANLALLDDIPGLLATASDRIRSVAERIEQGLSR